MLLVRSFKRHISSEFVYGISLFLSKKHDNLQLCSDIGFQILMFVDNPEITHIGQTEKMSSIERLPAQILKMIFDELWVRIAAAFISSVGSKTCQRSLLTMG